MTKQIVVFQNLAKASNNQTVNNHYLVTFCFGRARPEDGAMMFSNSCVRHIKTHDGKIP